MSGMNANTGRSMTRSASIAQSIVKIVTTPIGSCVERRTFGSLMPGMVDAPLNESTRMQAIAACASAIVKWEKRIRLKSLSLTQSADAPAQLIITLDAVEVDTDTQLSMQLPISLGGARV